MYLKKNIYGNKMIIFKYIGYILLALIIYNYLLVELEKRGIDKQDFYMQGRELIEKARQINVVESAPIIVPVGLILVLLC